VRGAAELGACVQACAAPEGGRERGFFWGGCCSVCCRCMQPLCTNSVGGVGMRQGGMVCGWGVLPCLQLGHAATGVASSWGTTASVVVGGAEWWRWWEGAEIVW
jgi:hypothetical protein